jgi:hypothetical protein
MRSRVLLTIVIVAAVLASAGCAKSAAPSTAANAQDVTVVILATSVTPGIAASIAPGDQVWLKSNRALVGTVQSVDASDAGELHLRSYALAQEVRVTVAGKAVVSDAGFSFGGTNLYVNSPEDYVTKKTVLKAAIISMEQTAK